MISSPERRSASPPQASAVDTQRPIHYNVDGTGRDTYINTNNGGFTTHRDGVVAVDPRIQFSRNLRGYAPD